MKVFFKLLNFLIISTLFILIKTTPSYEEYSKLFLDKIRIGSQSKEISLILSTLTSKTVLFTNSKRPYAQEIQRGRKSDVLIDKVSFVGQKIESFPFNLAIDETKLNNKDIQGIFGLGIDKEKTNDLIDILYDNQLITSKVIELDIEEGDKEDRAVCRADRKTTRPMPHRTLNQPDPGI